MGKIEREEEELLGDRVRASLICISTQWEQQNCKDNENNDIICYISGVEKGYLTYALLIAADQPHKHKAGNV